MSQRILYILGTACLVPTYERNHNGYFLRWDQEGFLFDPGEGTQRQMLFSGVSASQITKIFISHFHGDHCLGLPGVIQRMSLDRVQHPVEIYYPASGQQFYENLKNASLYHFQMELVECPFNQNGVIFKNDTFQVEAKVLDHTTDSVGYRIQEHDSYTLIPEKLQQFGLKGKRIRELQQNEEVQINGKTISIDQVSNPKQGQSFVCLLDTRFNKSLVEFAKDADLLVCDSTYLSDREEMAFEHGHMTASQAAQLAQKAGVKKLVLTHFSQTYKNNEEFEQEARIHFKNTVAAKDGSQILVSKQQRSLTVEK